MNELAKITNDFIPVDRTRYQIEHFVLGQHPTPEMQYKQLLIEAKSLIYSIEKSKIKEKRIKLEIQELQAKGDELSLLDAEDKRLDLAWEIYGLTAAKKELAILESLYNSFPKFTEEDIDENQSEYWEKRLSSQAENDIASAKLGIGVGNLSALRQANLIQMEELER